MSARTLEELLAHMRAVGPSVRSDPEWLADALDTIIAGIMEEAEGAIYGLHSRRYVGEADGSWLDEHGKERGVQRFLDEADDDYRVRVKAMPDMVTRPAILAELNKILLVGTARMEEWLTDAMYLDIQDRRGFLDMAAGHGDPRGFTIYIEEQLVSRSLRGFVLDDPADPFKAASSGHNHTFLGDGGDSLGDANETMFLDGTNPAGGDIYSRIYQLIDRLRAGGLGPDPHFMVEIQ